MNRNGIQGQNLNLMLSRFRFQRGLAFGVIIITALLAFEIFNYSTTDYALTDLLGNLTFLGVRWSTILAIAFCGIDFAGIARLFTPEQGAEEPGEVWYLFGAWLLAATMNAMLTWWGVSLAILNHQTLGNAVVDRTTLLRVVPIFVAVLVWLIRVLIIGTFSVAGDRLFSQADQRQHSHTRLVPQIPQPQPSVPVRSLGSRAPSARSAAASSSAFRPSPKTMASQEPNFSRPEPTYHNVSMSPNARNSFSANSNTATGFPSDTDTPSPSPRSGPNVRR